MALLQSARAKPPLSLATTILDLAVSSGGGFLYSLNSGNGAIGAWTINQSTGVLTANVGAVLPASNAGYNGIAAY